MTDDGAQKNRKWLSKQVKEYAKKELAIYELYSEVLKKILKMACKDCGVVGIVQARAKTKPSFAEKTLRKAHKYEDPLHQLTDLSGARVITETQSEVDRICEYIRGSDDIFIIDEKNSLDVASRLRFDEFGYLSVHYVVQLRQSDRLDDETNKDINKIGKRKAEIQVRTLLQHAWAAVHHDRIYKSDFDAPEKIKRDLARTAALLENADEAFAGAIDRIDTFKLYYGAYLTPEQIDREIETLELVQEHDPDNVFLAHKIARLAMANENWEKAVSALEPFRKTGKSFVLRDIGIAKSRMDKNGRTDLERAVAIDGSDADALCALAGTWLGEDDRTALRYYGQAYGFAPNNPAVLGPYLECKAGVVGNIDFITLMKPSLEAATAKCFALAGVNVYLPWAFFDIGRFAMLANQPEESLAAYARAVMLSNSIHPIEMALKSIEKLRKPVRRSLTELPGMADLEWLVEAVHRFLTAALVVKAKEAAPKTDDEPEKIPAEITARLDPLKSKDGLDACRDKSIIIVAGGCDAESDQVLKKYKGDIKEAFEGFKGVVIGGGTTAGLSGFIGDLVLESKGRILSYGCTPSSIPHSARIHEGYKTYPSTDIAKGKPTSAFTVLEPIQSWIDLIAAGVDPSGVKVLGINGGPISAFEYRMALALGADLGVVDSSGGSASELQSDEIWTGAPNLHLLPKDSMTLRAFVTQGRPGMSDEQIERAGKVIHGNFLDKNRYKNLDPTMMPWEKLREDLKESNRRQAAYIEEILGKIGWGVRDATVGHEPRAFTNEEVDIMAEMEHGRWIVERLQGGWRYGPRRDPENRLSPFLVSWSDLPDEIRDYDREAVRNFPTVLNSAGLKAFPSST